MATKTEQTNQKMMSKEVQIVCYLDVGDCDDGREVYDTLYEDVDYYEQETKVRERTGVFIGDEEFAVSKSMREAIAEADSGGIEVVTYEEESEEYCHSTSGIGRKIRRAGYSGVDVAMEQLGLEEYWSWKVKKGDRTVFVIEKDGLQQMGLLNHQSEFEKGNRWQDADAELWCTTLTIKVDQVKPDVYRWYDERVIPEIVQNVAEHPWVTRTRVMDCEKEYKEEGVCYGI